MPRNFIQHLSHLSLAFSLMTLFVGCQLLRPYQGPVAPVPTHWKGNIEASDEEQLGVPVGWKGDTFSPLAREELSNIKANSIDSHTNAMEKGSSLPEPNFAQICQKLNNWWEIFQDPILNQLEEQALDSSYTLWAALERVIEARATARTYFASLMPNISFAPSFSRTGSLIENPLSGIGIKQGNGAGAGANNLLQDIPSTFRFIQSQYLIPFNFNYEIDLWGQLNNTYYASLIRAQAVSQAYLSVLLSLTSDIASVYFQLRSLDTQQEVIEKNIGVRKRAVDINRARFNAGLIVYLDVSRAEVLLARAHADWEDTHRLRGLQENILATLIGTPASVFSIDKQPLLASLPVIPTGLPSELLCRRPDIVEAERNLAAAYREIGVAYANFFPSLNLNASLGVGSPFPFKLFSWKSRFWQIGLNILQSVFDGGSNQANLDYYTARFRETMANYQERVLQSFKDVEDSLVNLKGYARQSQDLILAVQAAQTTLNLSQLRYDRGLVNYLDVVDAERQLLETEQSSAIVLGNRYISTVMLIRALGGGWSMPETCNEEIE